VSPVGHDVPLFDVLAPRFNNEAFDNGVKDRGFAFVSLFIAFNAKDLITLDLNDATNAPFNFIDIFAFASGIFLFTFCLCCMLWVFGETAWLGLFEHRPTQLA
jgi:hypothetical protein